MESSNVLYRVFDDSGCWSEELGTFENALESARALDKEQNTSYIVMRYEEEFLLDEYDLEYGNQTPEDVIYWRMERKYRKQDAKNHIVNMLFLDSEDDMPDWITDNDIDQIVEMFFEYQDCDESENATWDYVLRDYSSKNNWKI